MKQRKNFEFYVQASLIRIIPPICVKSASSCEIRHRMSSRLYLNEVYPGKVCLLTQNVYLPHLGGNLSYSALYYATLKGTPNHANAVAGEYPRCPGS